MFLKNVKKILIILFLMLLEMNNNCFATNIIWANKENQMNIKNKVIFIDDRYYYVTLEEKPICSEYENRFKRINDTVFFVNDEGVIFKKEGWHYDLVQKGVLDEMINKDLTSENCIKQYDDDKYSIYIKKVNHDEVVKNTVYENLQENDVKDKAIVIGDSYAFLYNLYSKKNWPYVCCPGYDVGSIKNELVDRVPDNKYRYCIIFIGGNDFMEQTNTKLFIDNLQELANEIHNKGMKVVLTTYLDIDYNKAPMVYRNPLIKHKTYSRMVESVIENNDIIRVECADLLEKYGYFEGNDFIHPHKDFYGELEKRFIEAVNLEE